MISAEQFASMSEADKLALVQRLSAQRQAKLTLKVSEKGALSVYGMGRWPVTLYKSQWERLLGCADAIKQFIEDNNAVLAEKE